MSESAKRATCAGRTTRPAEVAVWDPFMRVFHWSVVLLFAVAWLSEDWQFIHQPIRYMIFALVSVRVL